MSRKKKNTSSTKPSNGRAQPPADGKMSKSEKQQRQREIAEGHLLRVAKSEGKDLSLLPDDEYQKLVDTTYKKLRRIPGALKV